MACCFGLLPWGLLARVNRGMVREDFDMSIHSSRILISACHWLHICEKSHWHCTLLYAYMYDLVSLCST